MARFAGIAAASMAIAATVALSAEPDYLGADELKALIMGKTIEVGDPSRVLFRVYFDADGQRYALQDGGEYALPWRVLPDGTQCVTTSEGDDCARVARNGDGTYTRYRDGSAVNLWLQIIPGKALAAPPSAPGVYARKTGPDHYVVLVNGPTVTERTARAQVTKVAQQVCSTLLPVLGEYRFESTEAVGAGEATNDSRVFHYTQEVSCVDGVKALFADGAPTLKTAEESREVEEDIRSRSAEFFRLLAANRMEETFAQVDGRALAQDLATWTRERRAFRMLAGAPVRINIVKITVYDNPAEAPNPGVYVAADYVNEYRNVPFHCGYLMWFRPIGGEFRITREETGDITAEQLQQIPVEQLPAIKQRMRCVGS